tara:strand:- start:334 stop:516 length:183 start_codon:yes stop_codon:yes gene_type:complete
MKIKETKIQQSQKLKEICDENDVNFESLEILLESVKTKKLQKGRHYHSQTIIDVIEKTIK